MAIYTACKLEMRININWLVSYWVNKVSFTCKEPGNIVRFYMFSYEI